MKRIIAFYTSARKNGRSDQLVNQVVAGAKSQGAEVITYDINQGVLGCQGCYYCRSHEGCATKDALQPVYEQIKEADGIVVGFPIYFGNISGQGKIWLDRMFPLLGPDLSPRYPGKKYISVYAQGNPDPDICKQAIALNNKFLSGFGWEMVDSILSYGIEGANEQIPEALLQRALEAGRNISK